MTAPAGCGPTSSCLDSPDRPSWPTSTQTASFTRNIALADGDGKLDRISGGSLFSGFQVTVQLGLGNGYFQPGVGFLAGPGPTGLAIADMDRDGLIDVLVANQGIDAVSLLRNTTLRTPRDLTVQQFIPGVLIAPIGGTVRVKDTTVNVGDQGAPTSTTRYRISTTSAPGTGITLVGQRVVPVLGPGRLSRGSADVVIPADTAPGLYYLMACADDQHVVSENDELNNCLVAATSVRIGPGRGGPRRHGCGHLRPAGPSGRELHCLRLRPQRWEPDGRCEHQPCVPVHRRHGGW